MKNLRKIVQEKAKNSKTKEELKKYYIIEELLKEDDCFFKIKQTDAYEILYNLGIEDIENYYESLISPENFKKTRQEIDLSNL